MRSLLLACALGLSCAPSEGERAAAPDAQGDRPAPDAAAPDRGALDGATDSATDAALDDGPTAVEAPAPVDTTALDAPPPEDAAPTMDGALCPSVSAPPADPDPWSVALPTAGGAAPREVSAGGHRDLYLAGPGGVAELAARLDWGGAVVFFGQAGVPGSNTIDGNDTGREVQVALYDPQRQHQRCAATATCAGMSPCGNSITFLGWDPVQGGDECNRGATLLRDERSAGRVSLAVRPVQWNPDWDAPDCRRSACAGAPRAADVTYTLGYRFVHPNVAEVSMEITSQEDLDHRPTEQEFPTLYVAHGAPGTDLPLLLDSAGVAITPDLPANDGFTYRNFTSPAPWVTWQHRARDYGVALLNDNGVTAWQGWEGNGRAAPYFHNVRPRQSFGLPSRGTVRGRAYLLLGSFETVRALADEVQRGRGPFGALDAPPAGAAAAVPVAGLRLRGWALDNRPGVRVSARVDGRDVAALARSTERADVCAVYPNHPECARVGFEGVLPAATLGGCARVLEVVAADADGNRTVLARRLVRP